MPISPRQCRARGVNHEPAAEPSRLRFPLSNRRYVPRAVTKPRPRGCSQRRVGEIDAAAEARNPSYLTSEIPVSTLAVTCAHTVRLLPPAAAPHANAMSASVLTQMTGLRPARAGGGGAGATWAAGVSGERASVET